MAQQLREFIAAHHVEKRDIWAERTVTFTDNDRLTPTVIAIWDVGVDPSVFSGRMWINTKEIPNNGKDDDGNGYIDDVYGIGWDWYGNKNVGPLRQLHISQAEIDTYKHYSKGFNDLEASLETPESTEARKKLSTLGKNEVKPFMEGLELYGLYAHGTHVSGIALAGNPACRVLVIRNDWPEQTPPPPPNQDWAQGWSAMLRDSVHYLRDHGARAVNMSWGISAQEIEDDMEASGSGGTVEERHATAERYFRMLNDSFVEAIKSAPNVLFIASAGNSNSDARFEQDIPAAFDLPNIMTVGAVDKAGDEASFTSFGKVDVYSNGYEVDSVLPGGDYQSWSGTSMAAPQVTNLAAKLLAKHPQLTAVQIKKLIVDGADEKIITGRKIRLLNEKRSFELTVQNAETK
jgi:subtilisin family serine protease